MALLIWITGLSGSGKTTLGRKLYDILKLDNPNTFMIDGDEFRTICDDLGYSKEDRIKNGLRMVRLAHQLNKQGINVICCTMSLFKEVTGQLKNAKAYFLDVDSEILMSRKPEIYSLTNLPGKDMDFDIPEDCTILKNNTESQMKRNLEAIWNGITQD